MDDAKAKVLFFDAGQRERVTSTVGRAPGLVLLEVGGTDQTPVPGAHDFKDVLAGSTRAVRMHRDEDDLFLSYTGGTTGLSKGVMTQCLGKVAFQLVKSSFMGR